MASSFSVKKYLSKITAPSLLSELAAGHDTQLLFDINDQTPRKLAIQLMEDGIKSLETEKRLDVLKDISYVASLTNQHTARLGKILFKEEFGKEFEADVECTTDHDLVLYLYLRHETIVQKLALLSPFYASKSYITYEAQTKEKVEVETKLTQLSREFTRIANKDDNATEQHMEYLFIDDVWHIASTFHQGYTVAETLNEEGTNRKNIARSLQTVRIAYIPKENVALIAGNITAQQKLIFLDTFLRIITGGGYEGKVEKYDLTPLRNFSFDFVHYNKGTPFIKASVRSITLSYADGKKKLRLALPNSKEHTNLQLLKESLDEIGLSERFPSCTLDAIALSFMFQNKDKQDKSVNVSCSLSPSRSNLCSLFEYERYAKSILKNAGMYEGFKLEKE